MVRTESQRQSMSDELDTRALRAEEQSEDDDIYVQISGYPETNRH